MTENPHCKCGSPCKKNGLSKKTGIQLYTTYCSNCAKSRHKQGDKVKRMYGYKLQKGTKCVSCGFVPIDRCQLDVDHIDGNSENNSPTNLQTLCANCHRLKTRMYGNYRKKKNR